MPLLSIIQFVNLWETSGPLGPLVLLVDAVKSPATIVTEWIFKDNHSTDSVTWLFPTFR